MWLFLAACSSGDLVEGAGALRLGGPNGFAGLDLDGDGRLTGRDASPGSAVIYLRGPGVERGATSSDAVLSRAGEAWVIRGDFGGDAVELWFAGSFPLVNGASALTAFSSTGALTGASDAAGGTLKVKPGGATADGQLGGAFSAQLDEGSGPVAWTVEGFAFRGIPQVDGVLGLTSSLDGQFPTVAHVGFDTDIDAVAWVEYGLDGVLDRSTPETLSGLRHDLSLLGLKAARDYSFRPMLRVTSGEVLAGPTGIVTTGAVPIGLPVVTLTASLPELRDDPSAFVLVNYLSSSADGVVIFDPEGDPVWWYEAPPDLLPVSPKPDRDGRSLVWNWHSGDITLSPGLLRVALDGSFEEEVPLITPHHDFHQHVDGRLASITYRLETGLLPGGPPGLLPLATDRISVDGATLFDVRDDWLAPTKICSHVTFDDFVAGHWNTTHANSLMYVPERDEYWMLSKHADAMARVNAATGALVDQVGGAASDWVVADPWSHAHMSHAWDGGFALFDNAYAHGRTVSRAVEYTFDEAGGTLDVVWSYEDPLGRTASSLGDVRRLDNGNHLVSWSAIGHINEIDPAGNVVWEVTSNPTVTLGRVRLLPDLYALPEP